MELQNVTGNIRKFLVKIITNLVEMTALSLKKKPNDKDCSGGQQYCRT